MMKAFFEILAVSILFFGVACSEDSHTEVKFIDNANKLATDSKYFKNCVLAYGVADAKIFSKKELSEAIAKNEIASPEVFNISNELKEKVFDVSGAGGANAMRQEEYDKLADDSIFRKLRYNEASQALLTNERLYSSQIPIKKALPIMILISSKL